MVNIRISYESHEELQAILEALDPVIILKSVKGYKPGKPFQKRYITAKIKCSDSQNS